MPVAPCEGWRGCDPSLVTFRFGGSGQGCELSFFSANGSVYDLWRGKMPYRWGQSQKGFYESRLRLLPVAQATGDQPDVEHSGTYVCKQNSLVGGLLSQSC